jgi:hypothetical protein
LIIDTPDVGQGFAHETDDPAKFSPVKMVTFVFFLGGAGRSSCVLLGELGDGAQDDSGLGSSLLFLGGSFSSSSSSPAPRESTASSAPQNISVSVSLKGPRVNTEE